VNGTHLLDCIDPNNVFLAELASVGCLTWRQREHIMSLGTPCDQTDKLLELLTRKSVAHFQKFINVVAKEQHHILPLLTQEGQDVLFHFRIHFAVLSLG